jgi:hypothetical protein
VSVDASEPGERYEEIAEDAYVEGRVISSLGGSGVCTTGSVADSTRLNSNARCRGLMPVLRGKQKMLTSQ